MITPQHLLCRGTGCQWAVSKGPAPLLLASPPTPFLALHPRRALRSQKNEGSASRGQKGVPPKALGIPFVEHLLPLTCPRVLGLSEEKILWWDVQYPIALGCWGRAYHQQPLPTNNFLSPASQPALPHSTNTQR